MPTRSERHGKSPRCRSSIPHQTPCAVADTFFWSLGSFWAFFCSFEAFFAGPNNDFANPAAAASHANVDMQSNNHPLASADGLIPDQEDHTVRSRYASTALSSRYSGDAWDTSSAVNRPLSPYSDDVASPPLGAVGGGGGSHIVGAGGSSATPPTFSTEGHRSSLSFPNVALSPNTSTPDLDSPGTAEPGQALLSQTAPSLSNLSQKHASVTGAFSRNQFDPYSFSMSDERTFPFLS